MHRILAFLFLFSMVGCKSPGSRTNSNAWSGSEADPSIGNMGEGLHLIVLAGGRGSCPLVGYPAEANLWRQLRATLPSEQKFTIARTCYSFETGQTANFDIVLFENGVITRKLLSWKSGTRDELLLQLLPYANIARKITMVGQSYGGFTVHFLAHKLSIDRQLLTTLITVEPISPFECTATMWAVKSPKCQNFPDDMLIASIRNNFQGFWANFYQDSFERLHSGVTSEADENIYLDFPNPAFAVMGEHQLTESDPRVWTYVKDHL